MQSILSAISSELASRAKQHAVSKRIYLRVGSNGHRDLNILVSSDGLKLSMLVIVKKVLAL